MISWIPEKNLMPSVELKGNVNQPLNIIPQNAFDSEMVPTPEKDTANHGEWSLIAFSFLTTLSVAKMITSLIRWNLS